MADRAKSIKGAGMNVQLGDWLEDNLQNFDQSIQKAVFDFMVHLKNYGFKGLKGRNKSSVDLSDETKKGRERAKFAQKHCLYHYHLGVLTYVEQVNGDFTSEMILHYCYYDDLIVLVDVAVHPPFTLPDVHKINSF